MTERFWFYSNSRCIQEDTVHLKPQQEKNWRSVHCIDPCIETLTDHVFWRYRVQTARGGGLTEYSEGTGFRQRGEVSWLSILKVPGSDSEGWCPDSVLLWISLLPAAKFRHNAWIETLRVAFYCIPNSIRTKHGIMRVNKVLVSDSVVKQMLKTTN
jgi:hypothetical protein